MNKVTIETIAREANVSVGTVDRALHGRERIKPETKQKILKTAQRLGYQPNKIASALGRQKKYRIGVIMPQDLPQEPLFFFGNVAEGVKEARARETAVRNIRRAFSIPRVGCDSAGRF